jgi:hypothetical protein
MEDAPGRSAKFIERHPASAGKKKGNAMPQKWREAHEHYIDMKF